MKNFREVAPRVKTIESLRNCALNNEHAIADIVDNSFDAGADLVIITLDKKDYVTVFDNGKGMSLDKMYEALTLGSSTGHEDGDLGKFGMGLKVSGTSMGRRLELLSKEIGEEPHKVVYDLDHMQATGKWEAWDEPLSPAEMKDFANIAHGTYVNISKLDNVKKQVEGCTVNYLRRAFRNFLGNGKTICVNSKDLTPIDPLERGDKGTIIHLDKNIKLNGKNVHFTVAEVCTDRSDLSAEKENNNRLKVGLQNQGFFVVRNGREIKGPDGLDIYDRHPSANRFRCEISFSEDADKEFGVPPTKDNVTLNDAMKLAIIRTVGKYRTAIMNKSKKKTRVEAAKEIDHSDAERLISACKDLDMKKSKKEKRNSPKVKGVTPVPKPVNPNVPKVKKLRRNFRFIQPSTNSMPAEFQEAALGEYGRLFDCYFDKGKIVIRWNYEHPFHEQVIAKYRKDKNILTPIDLLAYSLSVELLSSESEEIELAMDNAIETMSSNLRKLMDE